MWASAQNISGAGWSGMAEATSLDTMTQMNQAFRNIVNMLHGVCQLRRSLPRYARSLTGWCQLRRSLPRYARSLTGWCQLRRSLPRYARSLTGTHPVQHVHDVAKRLIHLGHGV